MKTSTFFFVVTISILTSCGQVNTPIENSNEDSVLTNQDKIKRDSIEFEKYERYYNQTTYENLKSYDTKIIAAFEMDRDTVAILEFLKENISKMFGHDDFPFLPEDLLPYTYQIDINNDADKDFIYQGPTGGKPNMTVVFLKQGNSFSEVFRQYQDVFEMKFKDNKLSRLSLTNPGCCADPQVVDYYYTVSFFDDKPKFELARTTGYLRGYEKPAQKFNQTQKITITKEGAKLRNDCYELDTEHPYYGASGNVLATYQAGSTGKALAEKNDKGVIWLYVLMDKKSIFDRDDFPTFKEQPIELYGWVKKDETNLK